MDDNGHIFTWLQNLAPTTAKHRLFSAKVAEPTLQLSQMGSFEDLSAEIAAAKRRLKAQGKPLGTRRFFKLQEQQLPDPSRLIQQPTLEPSHSSDGGDVDRMISPENGTLMTTPKALGLPSNEARMTEPSTGSTKSIQELRALEQQALRQLAEGQAKLAAVETSHQQVLADVEQADQKVVALYAAAEQRRKDRETAEHRLAEVALTTEQGTKKIREFENRLHEFMTAVEFAVQSRGMAEARVAEIREEIKHLGAELAQCEERAAQERLAEEHAATERAAAEQRLEKERIAAQPFVEELEQAQAFLQEDRETEQLAFAAYEEERNLSATFHSVLQKAQEDHRVVEGRVMHLQNLAARATRERIKAEKLAEELATAQEREQIEHQLADLRAAEERAAQERATVEHKLAEIRIAQQRAAQEREALENAALDELAKPHANGKITETVLPSAPVAEVEPQEQYAAENSFESNQQSFEEPPTQEYLDEEDVVPQAVHSEEELGHSAVSKPGSIRMKIDATTYVVPARKATPQPEHLADIEPVTVPIADSEDETGTEDDASVDLAEALRRAAEEQRAAARERQTQQNGQRAPLLGVFGRKKPEQPEAQAEPQLSISERIERDFGNLNES